MPLAFFSLCIPQTSIRLKLDAKNFLPSFPPPSLPPRLRHLYSSLLPTLLTDRHSPPTVFTAHATRRQHSSLPMWSGRGAHCSATTVLAGLGGHQDLIHTWYGLLFTALYTSLTQWRFFFVCGSGFLTDVDGTRLWVNITVLPETREIENFPAYIQVFDEHASSQPSLQAVWQSRVWLLRDSGEFKCYLVQLAFPWLGHPA